LEVIDASLRPGGLQGKALQWATQHAVTVVLASAGYPESSSSGDVISGVGELPHEVFVTHAGTARNGRGELVTAGGRVLSLTALGADISSARSAAYAAADMVQFEGKQLRRDIAGGV